MSKFIPQNLQNLDPRSESFKNALIENLESLAESINNISNDNISSGKKISWEKIDFTGFLKYFNSTLLPNITLPELPDGVIVDGGNTEGAAVTVGTNDAYGLNLETNGTTRVSITSAGLIGINNSSPNYEIDLLKSSGYAYQQLVGADGAIIRLKKSGNSVGAIAALGAVNYNGDYVALVEYNCGVVTASDGTLGGATNSGCVRFSAGLNGDFQYRATIIPTASNSGGTHGTLFGIGLQYPTQTLDISSATTETYLGIKTTSTGETVADGLKIGVDSSSNAIINNLENKDIIFYCNGTETARSVAGGEFTVVGNVTSSSDLVAKKSFKVLGATEGCYDDTQSSSGGASTTVDAFRFLDVSSAVLTGSISGTFYVTIQDGSNRKSLTFTYNNNGNGITGDVIGTAVTSETATDPWASHDVVADGSGVKLQITTSAGGSTRAIRVRFVGVVHQ